MGKLRVFSLRESSERKRIRVTPYKCQFCNYVSNRYFNILRHQGRIHEAPKRRPHCCDTKFETKAEYYRHCEDVHPGRRINLTSQKKYGIRNDSLEDTNESQSSGRGYPQTRYMLRSHVRFYSYAELIVNSSESNEDNVPIEANTINNSTEESSERPSYDFSLKNTTASSSDNGEDEGTLYLDREDSQENLDKSYFNDSQTSEDSGNEENHEDNDSQIVNNEIPNSIVEREDFNRGQSSDLGEEIVTPSGSDSTTESSVFNFAIATEDTKISLGTMISSTPSKLPLKKRILRNLSVQNGENIENLRIPLRERSNRGSINVDGKFGQASMKSEQSKKKKRRGGKKSMKISSASDDAENVPPGVSINHQQEEIRIEFPDDRNCPWPKVSAIHREYLEPLYDVFSERFQ